VAVAVACSEAFHSHVHMQSQNHPEIENIGKFEKCRTDENSRTNNNRNYPWIYM
jgi:hypothetical protein